MTGTHTASRAAWRRGLLASALFALAAGPAGAAHHEAAEGDPALKQIDTFIEEQGVDKEQRNWRLKLARPPELSFEAGKSYYWVLDTSVGALKVELFTDVAPMHASSTIYLTRLGFYDGLGFHRVINGFMAQGGDPVGNGTGGPGYEYDGEFSDDAKAKHTRKGVLSMANRGPGTDGSQFFLTFTATPHLDGKHTVFGHIVEGEGTLAELESRGSRSGRPAEPLEIRKATIVVE